MKLLTPVSELEGSSQSVALGRERGLAGEASPERRREFDSILSHSLPRFRLLAMRWLRNPEDAEDAVQDAMLSAFRHIGGFDGRAQMSTWLTAIVINAVRMQLRRRSRSRTLSLDHSHEEGQLSISEMIADPRPSPEKNLEQRELRALVNEVVVSLPRAQQAALRLRLCDDLSIQEAAKTLGVPEGTVKARLARGRAKIMQRFHKAAGTRHRQRCAPLGR